MNRRSFFSFLAGAPLAVAAGSVVAIRIDGGGTVRHHHYPYIRAMDVRLRKLSELRPAYEWSINNGWIPTPEFRQLLEQS